VHEFFAAKPFRIRLDASRSLRTVVRDVLDQAEERQKTTPGVYYAGAVMQHMVGAKLDCALGPGKFEHNSFSTSDQQSGRSGDFFLGDVAIHVTTSPGEAVIERCRDNLNDGNRPILVTGQRGLTVAEGLADNAGLADRIDVSVAMKPRLFRSVFRRFASGLPPAILSKRSFVSQYSRRPPWTPT